MSLKSAIGPKPQAVDAHSTQHVAIFERLFQGLGLFRAGSGIKISFDGEQYIISATTTPIVRPGGYAGEYDPTKSYSAGQQFIISAPLTIRSVVLPKGLYGVRPASANVDSQTFGPWAGNLPADPSSSSVDMDKLFFIPANTFPTLGAAPNDVLYAELIAELC